jgi:hypothetical protein
VLKPRKAACIVAATRELLDGASANVETTLRTLLGEDVGLMIDTILLGSAGATPGAPAGLFAGVTPLTATAGGGVNALLGDTKKLLAAIAPAMRPVLLMNTTQAATLGMLAPASAVPVIAAPYMTANSIAAIDASTFASALGVPEFRTDENPTVHMSDAPLPLVGGTTQPPALADVAAPVTSLWQVEAIGIRTILPVDWSLRRSNAVALVTGVSW